MERKVTLVVESRIDIRTLAELSIEFPEFKSRSALISGGLEELMTSVWNNRRMSSIEDAIVILRDRGLIKGGDRFNKSLVKIQQDEVKRSEQQGADPYDVIEEMQRGNIQ
ncbi:MAG TPA: hypothetical protein ENH82_13785 [bacterium]|nr:hypothetical protein [bacterium]